MDCPINNHLFLKKNIFLTKSNFLNGPIVFKFSCFFKKFFEIILIILLFLLNKNSYFN